MLIVDDRNKSVMIDSLQTKLSSTHFWVLDLQMLDFTLNPLTILEERWCQCVAIEVENFVFSIPATWHVLISDEDTSMLDVVKVEQLSSKRFELVVYDNEKSFTHVSPARVVDMSTDEPVYNPSLNRHHMLCHPIAPSRWICLAPNDSYNKYLKNLTLGDII